MAKSTKKRAKTVKINVGEFPFADLMPQSRIDAIERKKATKEWVGRIIGAVVIMLLVSAGSVAFKIWNQMQYDAQVDKKAEIDLSISGLADVDRAVSIQLMIEENIKTATVAQINWVDLIERVQSNLPPNSSLKTFNVAAGGYMDNQAAVGIQMTITSSEPIAYSMLSSTVTSIPGFMGDLEIGNMTAASAPGPADPDGRPPGTVSTYTYPIAFSLDTSILLHKQQEEGVALPEPQEDPAKIDEEEPLGDETGVDDDGDPNTPDSVSTTNPETEETTAPETEGVNP